MHTSKQLLSENIEPSLHASTGITKMGLLLLLLAFLQVNANGHPQNKSQIISFSGQDVPLEKVLQAVTTQTGFRFFYKQSLLKDATAVSVNANNVSLEEFLNSVFKNQPFEYTIENKNIILSRKQTAAKDHALNNLSSPPIVLHGRVTDSLGNPLAGASVIIKGTSRGTSTNTNGEFSMSGVHEHDVLVISYAGYLSKQIKADAGDGITVVLFIATGALQDVIVNKGYYRTSQKLNTGAVATVSAREIADQPIGDPLSALQGRVAGVEITSSSGTPGTSIDIKIRGLNTNFSATAYPLYIVDGVAVPNSSITTPGVGYTGLSPINSINPGDIESIDILKDADATAVYGSRGANGVVLITTKKGKAGAMRFDLDLSAGFSQAAHLLNSWLSTPEYLDMRKKAFALDGIDPDVDNAPDLILWDQHAHTDWQKRIIGNTASFSNMQGTLSGGDERTKYLASFSYAHNGGIQWGSNYDNRANFHINIESNSKNKRFLMNTSVTYSNNDNRQTGNSPLSDIWTAPNMPLYDSTGAIYRIPGNYDVVNPLYGLYQYTLTKTNNIIANTRLRYAILPNLDASVSLGYNKMQQNGYQVFPSISLNPDFYYPVFNQASFSNNYTGTMVAEPQLDYNTNISRGKFQVLAGGTWQQTETSTNTIAGDNFSSDALLHNIGAAADVFNKQSGTTLYKYESVFGRVNYNWLDKYVFNGSFRQDGSSRFGNGYKFGNFWAVGGAWLFSNENFFKNAQNAIGYGKLRASYGIVGNDQIGDYQYLSFYGPTMNIYNSLPAIYSIQVANSNYRWEETRKLDVGLEWLMLNSRVSVAIDWYRNRSGNLLTLVPLAAQTGYSFYTANLPALVQNRGWEFSLNTINVKTKNFKWASSINLTLPKNTLLAFPNLANSSYSDKYEVGKSIRVVKEYQFAGIDPQRGLPLFRKPDGTVTDGSATGGGALGVQSDYASIGNLDPSAFGGFGNTFTYRGIELNVFFQFSRSHTSQSYFYSQYIPTGGLINTIRPLVDGAWKNPGDHAIYPALTTNFDSPSGNIYTTVSAYSSANYVDNSYIRLKTVSLAWTVPGQLVHKLKGSSLKLIARGQNLLTFTKYIGFDPETTNLGIPVLRTITFGLNASF